MTGTGGTCTRNNVKLYTYQMYGMSRIGTALYTCTVGNYHVQLQLYLCNSTLVHTCTVSIYIISNKIKNQSLDFLQLYNFFKRLRYLCMYNSYMYMYAQVQVQ